MDREFSVVTDVEFLKRQWLTLIDRWGEAYIRQQLNKGRAISKIHKDLENATPDQ